MKRRNRGNTILFRIGLSYLFFTGIALILCIRVEMFAEYASESRPYSILFSRYINRGLDESDSTKVIYFGDSTLFYPPDEKVSEEGGYCHTPALLQEVLHSQTPGKKMTVSEWAFPMATMYHYYCMIYRAVEFSPDLVIIPINWNSFRHIWEIAGNTGFPELCALVPLSEVLVSDMENSVRLKGISPVRHLRYKVEILKLYPEGLRGWMKSKLISAPEKESPQKPVNANMEEEKSPPRLRKSEEQFLQIAYPLDISRSDEMCRLTRAVAILGSRKDTKILFYISPLNTEYLGEIGYLDREKLEASKQIIVEATKEQGTYCVDLSDLLSDEDFYDPMLHYSVHGRTKLAEALAPKVLEILQEHPAKN